MQVQWEKILSTERLRHSTRNQDIRNDFESDLGRIVFSPAIRRMHDKTQVFPLTSDDNIHTRLTHSMEVQSIAYSLGIQICCDPRFRRMFKNYPIEKILRIIPIILSSISLCHDIGNPPFGHYGEHVIGEYFEKKFAEDVNILSDGNQKLDFIKFNGNAQGFRLLTKSQVLQDQFGINLTVGTLSAFLKYPSLSSEIEENGYHSKLGIYQSEKDHIEKIRSITGLITQRNPLSFLMEAADTICYRTMDIEDGYNKRYYSFDEILEFLQSFGCKNVKNKIQRFKRNTLNKMKIAINLDNTKMVYFRVFLIQELVNLAIENFLKNYKFIMSGEYYGELIKDEDYKLERALKEFTIKNIYQNREILSLEVAGGTILKGLLDHFVNDLIIDARSKKSEKLFGLISNSLKSTIEIEQEMDLHDVNNYYKLRLIVDFISSMTDNYALKVYQKLEGIKIN